MIKKKNSKIKNLSRLVVKIAKEINGLIKKGVL